MKNRKSSGTDELPIELFEYLYEEGIEEIVDMCNKMYDKGIGLKTL